MKTRHILPLITALGACGAWAHPGHGMPGASHWHAGDVAIFFVVAVIAAIAVWMARGGRK